MKLQTLKISQIMREMCNSRLEFWLSRKRIKTVKKLFKAEKNIFPWYLTDFCKRSLKPRMFQMKLGSTMQHFKDKWFACKAQIGSF